MGDSTCLRSQLSPGSSNPPGTAHDLFSEYQEARSLLIQLLFFSKTRGSACNENGGFGMFRTGVSIYASLGVSTGEDHLRKIVRVCVILRVVQWLFLVPRAIKLAAACWFPERNSLGQGRVREYAHGTSARFIRAF